LREIAIALIDLSKTQSLPSVVTVGKGSQVSPASEVFQSRKDGV
jgi:hypothetical protein